MGKPYPTYQPTRCTAHRKSDGEACGNWAIRGNVCRKHGGAVKATKEAAARRILAAADPAAALLVAQMYDTKLDPNIRQRAARDLLDRAGITSRTELSIEVRPWEQAIPNILIEIGDDAPERDPAMDAQIKAWNAEVSEIGTRDAPPRELEAWEEAELVVEEAERAAPPPVEPTSLSDRPPARLDPDNLRGARTRSIRRPKR